MYEVELAPSGDRDRIPRLLRNPRRGLRGEEAIARRRVQRSLKRWEARREHRISKRQQKPPAAGEFFEGVSRPQDLRVSGAFGAPSGPHTGAAADQANDRRLPPGGRKLPKIRIGQKWEFGNINIQGMRALVKREEVERWMSKEKISAMVITETHIPETQVEKRKKIHMVFLGAGRRRR